jgi:signal peptide peptidase SppA
MTDEVFDSSDAISEFRTLMQDPAARQAFLRVKESAAEGGARVRYEHILRAVGETPWAIRPAMLGVIVDILAFRAEGGRLSAEEVSQRIGAARTRSQSPSGVAILPLHGVIVPKAGLMSEVSGATSIEGFRSQFRQAMSASEVSSVVIDVDSPGGMVDQVPEMAAEMRAARGKKPIVAVANSEASSAAYWLASQADQFVVTKSGRVGSIGVFTAHEDESAKRDSEGVKTTLVSAGRFKTEGNPFEPLSEGAKAHLQGLVDDYYGMFVSDVAKGRGVGVNDVRKGFGEGRVVSAADSVKLGMADGVGSREGTVQALLQPAASSYTLPIASSAPSLFEADAESESSDQPTGLSAEELADLETRLRVLAE